MEIESHINLQNGTHWVQFSMPSCGEPLSGAEKDALIRFGNMLVEFGGTFTSAAVTFTLPTNQLRVPGQLPTKQGFSILDYGANANTAARLWQSTMQFRLSNALAVLLAQDPGQLGRQVMNLYPVADPNLVTADTQLGDWMEL